MRTFLCTDAVYQYIPINIVGLLIYKNATSVLLTVDMLYLSYINKKSNMVTGKTVTEDVSINNIESNKSINISGC